MHKLALALFLLAASTFQTAAQENQKHTRVATTCFLVGEEQSRTDKICHYKCAIVALAARHGILQCTNSENSRWRVD